MSTQGRAALEVLNDIEESIPYEEHVKHYNGREELERRLLFAIGLLGNNFDVYRAHVYSCYEGCDICRRVGPAWDAARRHTAKSRDYRMNEGGPYFDGVLRYAEAAVADLVAAAGIQPVQAKAIERSAGLLGRIQWLIFGR